MASDKSVNYVLRTKESATPLVMSGAGANTEMQIVPRVDNVTVEETWLLGGQVSAQTYRAAKPTAVAVGDWPLPQDVMLQLEAERLMEQVAELEEEVEVILTSFANQEFRILDGYIVCVRPGIDVPFVAECPKLRAVAQGDTLEETLADLREAMNLFMECRQDHGKPIPPKDVEAQ